MQPPDCRLNDLRRLQCTREILEGARVLSPEPRSLRSQEGLHAFGGSCVSWSDPWRGPCPCPPCPKSAKQNSSKDPSLPSLFLVGRVNKSMSLGGRGEDCPTHTDPLHLHSISTPVELAPVTPTRWGAGAWSLGFSQGKGKPGQAQGWPTADARGKRTQVALATFSIPSIDCGFHACMCKARRPCHPVPSYPHHITAHPAHTPFSGTYPHTLPYSSTRSIPPPLIRLYGYPCLFFFLFAFLPHTPLSTLSTPCGPVALRLCDSVTLCVDFSGLARHTPMVFSTFIRLHTPRPWPFAFG